MIKAVERKAARESDARNRIRLADSVRQLQSNHDREVRRLEELIDQFTKAPVGHASIYQDFTRPSQRLSMDAVVDRAQVERLYLAARPDPIPYSIQVDEHAFRYHRDALIMSLARQIATRVIIDIEERKQ